MSSDHADVSELQREWCSKVLEQVKTLSSRAQKDYRDPYRAYLLKGNVTKLSPATMTNYMHRIPHGEGAIPAFEFVRTHSLPVLDKMTFLQEKERAAREKIRELVEAFERTNATGVSPSLALKALLNIDPAAFNNPEDLQGEYYGYRRSASEGQIIRFHIGIKRSSETNIVWFENQFFRGTANWETVGFGLSAGSINFLVGQATSEAGLALGLRCFALVRYETLGWLFGTLLSVHHEKRTPIAARVVLIPEKYHHPDLLTTAKEKDERVQQIVERIKGGLNPAQLDDDIQQFNRGKSVFQGTRKASDYIRFLIRNWTLTTLEASQEDLPLDDVALAQLRKIWDLEEQLAGAWEKVGTEKGRYLVALEHVMSDRRALYG